MTLIKHKARNFITLLAALMLSANALAANIGIVDAQAALRASNAAKAFDEQLKADLESARAELVALEGQIKAKQNELRQNQDLLSQEQLRAEDDKYRQMVQSFQVRRQALNQEQVKREQAFLKQVRPVIRAAVIQIAEEKKLDLILNREAAAYASASLDVTARLIEILNTQK